VIGPVLPRRDHRLELADQGERGAEITVEIAQIA
jgi:hypothetical protein